jgi:hypothetical protein
MEKLEKTLVDNRGDVEYELKQAEEKKRDPPLIDNLEKKLVEVKAQLRFVGEDAEAALKQKDEVLRAKLPGQTNGIYLKFIYFISMKQRKWKLWNKSKILFKNEVLMK